jgi:hypothetical protein
MQRGTGRRVGKTIRLDWKPLHPQIPVTGDFAAYAMSLYGLANNHET